MPTPLRLRPSGPQWPYSIAMLRQDEPQLSISASPHAGEIASWLALDPPIVFVTPEATEPPEHDPAAYRAVEARPVEVDGQWRQAWELEQLPAPEPQPDWGRFKSGLLTSETVAAVMAAARVAGCEPAVSALPVALEKAQSGQPGEFAACWALVAAAGAAPPEALAALAASAEACHLPAAFIEALNPSPPGLTRARDEAGRFIADDPATPQDEAWVASE